MKQLLSTCALAAALACSPVLAYAGGGGGIEYLTNLGSDVLAKIPIPGSALLDVPTGSITGFSAFGYGITWGGWKIGGFATGLYTGPLSIPVPSLGGNVTGMAGGFGGVISGGHARLGPFSLSLNVRLGAGGLGVQYAQTTTGVFSLYGALDAEIGLVFVPAMMISAFAGVHALVPMSYAGIFPFAAPAAGIRITWGSF
jgi:hypothetical protein